MQYIFIAQSGSLIVGHVLLLKSIDGIPLLYLCFVSLLSISVNLTIIATATLRPLQLRVRSVQRAQPACSNSTMERYAMTSSTHFQVVKL